MTKTEPTTARKPRRAARAPELETPNDAGNTEAGSTDAEAGTNDGAAAQAQRTTKTSIVLDLLRREQGRFWRTSSRRPAGSRTRRERR